VTLFVVAAPHKLVEAALFASLGVVLIEELKLA